MPCLTPCTIPLRQNVPVANALSRFKKPVSDSVTTLIYWETAENWEQLPYLTGFFQGVDHLALTVSGTVMTGVTHDNPLLSSVLMQRKERHDQRSGTYHKETGRDHIKEE